ncbi:MAG: hypothetical protein K2M04_03690 [Muribaculaceae bacterium]|nr:hypothetical protein [Muribaculaceae bacterium]
MKKIFFTSVLCSIVAMMTSCSLVSSIMGEAANPADKGESYAKAIELVNKNLDGNKYKIYSVRFSEGKTLSNDLGDITLYLVDSDNQKFKQKIYIDGTVDELIPHDTLQKVEYEKLKGIDLSEINTSALEGYFEEAKTMLPEGHSFRSIGEYVVEEIISGSKAYTGENKNRFTVCFTEDGNSVEQKGRVITTNYYEASVYIQPDGTLEVED